MNNTILVNNLTQEQKIFLTRKLVKKNLSNEKLIYYLNATVNEVCDFLNISIDKFYEKDLSHSYDVNEIDEKLRDVIEILNNKGYITRYCCQGHEPFYNGYISFDSYYDFNISILNSLSYNKYNDNCIRWKSKSEQENNNTIKELKKWVKEL